MSIICRRQLFCTGALWPGSHDLLGGAAQPGGSKEAAMGKKCCKRKKKKGIAAVDREKRAIFYFEPLADMSIKGQRGCTAKAPACLPGVPA